MIIDCISDLHGHYPKLDGGDLLIVAGDLTSRIEDLDDFQKWLLDQGILNYKKVIYIAGNHDNWIEKNITINSYFAGGEYLCDSGTEFHYFDERFPEEDEGFLPSGKRTLKIWGSPWTKKFKDQNPKAMAFALDTEEELAEKWSLIPDDLDILITHSPIHGVLDKITSGEHVGSTSLRKYINRIKPRLWITGHIHEAYGEFKDITLAGDDFHFVNASHVNEHYEPVNKPIRIEL